MRDIAWKLIEVMALQLTPTEREIVLGDLIETRETALRGMREMSGLVVFGSRVRAENPLELVGCQGSAMLPCHLLALRRQSLSCSRYNQNYGRSP